MSGDVGCRSVARRGKHRGGETERERERERGSILLPLKTLSTLPSPPPPPRLSIASPPASCRTKRPTASCKNSLDSRLDCVAVCCVLRLPRDVVLSRFEPRKLSILCCARRSFRDTLGNCSSAGNRFSTAVARLANSYVPPSVIFSFTRLC